MAGREPGPITTRRHIWQGRAPRRKPGCGCFSREGALSMRRKRLPWCSKTIRPSMRAPARASPRQATSSWTRAAWMARRCGPAPSPASRRRKIPSSPRGACVTTRPTCCSAGPARKHSPASAESLNTGTSCSSPRGSAHAGRSCTHSRTPRAIGTIGAVAVDGKGHLAACTSTGGTPYKRPGRVGDTPIIGAGTYADDHEAAASSTGLGEAILKVTMARAACVRVRDGMSPRKAAAAAVGYGAS